MTRKNNNNKHTHSSTWLWGTEGTGAAFVGTKICSLAAKGFGSFVKPSSHTSDSPVNEESLATEIPPPITTLHSHAIDPLSTPCSSTANDSSGIHVKANSSATISRASINTSLAASSSGNNITSSPSVSEAISSRSTPTTTEQNLLSHASCHQGLYIIYTVANLDLCCQLLIT